jgi:hypothetical protein
LRTALGQLSRDELTGEVKASLSYVVADVADNEIDVRLVTKAHTVEQMVLETYDRR